MVGVMGKEEPGQYTKVLLHKQPVTLDGTRIIKLGVLKNVIWNFTIESIFVFFGGICIFMWARMCISDFFAIKSEEKARAKWH
jgi:hypothetical protein